MPLKVAASLPAPAGQVSAPPTDDQAARRGWVRRITLAGLPVLMIGCGLLSVSHGVDGMWDTRNYHLYTPFISHHDRYGVDIAPAQQQTYLNPLLDYPFYAAVRLFNGSPRLVAFLMGLPQGINLWFVWLIGWRFAGGSSLVSRACLALLVTFIGATGAGTLPLVGAATGDVLVSVPVLGAVLLLLGVADADPDARATRLGLLGCGLLAGLATGAKPTMACYALGIVAALPFAMPVRLLPAGLMRFVAAAAAGAIATGGYHAVRLFRLFGNPLFPLANTLFRSPFWENAPLRDTRFLPADVWSALTFPFAWAAGTDHGVAAELGFRDIRIALALSAVVLAGAVALVARRPRMWAARSTPVLFVAVLVAYAAWLAVFSIYRYLLPIEMLSGVLMLAAVRVLARPGPAVVSVLMTAAAVACWVTMRPLEWGHTPFEDRYVAVTAPRIEPGSLVLIVGTDPVSYLIPFVGADAHWLGLDNNLLHPGQSNGLVARERAAIEEQTGPILVLDAGAAPSTVGAVLAAYGLAADPDRCGSVSSNLGSETYSLCAVRRMPG